MPAGPLAHICFVVRDLDAAIDRWRRILAVLDPGQLEQPIVRYDGFVAGGDEVDMAIFASPHGAEIQLLTPKNDGPTAKRLERHGEGVHHIAFTHPDVAVIARELEEAGVALTTRDPMVAPSVPWLEFTFIAPQSASGTLVEICTAYEPVDGRWEPSGVDPRRP